MRIERATELVHFIERQVADGALQPGERLPSVRENAEALNLSPNTVAAAYRRLRERGVVVGRGRQGTVVAERAPVAQAPHSRLPAGVVDAMTGNPDASMLPDLAPALGRALAAPTARYGDVLVDPELAEVGRGVFVGDGINADALTVVSGAMDAVERLLRAHLRPGDRVGVEDPGYAAVHQLISGLGYTTVAIQVDQEGLVPDELGAALAGGLEALVMTPRSQNPTGAALTHQRARELDSVLQQYPATMVIEDDHAGMVAGVDFVGLNRDRPRWAVVRSVAKSLGPDLRLALVAADRETVDRVEGRLQLGPGWVSHLLQRAVTYLLTDPDALGQVHAASNVYRQRREGMLAMLAELGVAASAPSGLHVWVPVPDEQSVVLGLLDAGYAVRAGDAYRVGAPPAVRITTAALRTEDAHGLSQALARLLEPATAASRIA